MKLRLEPYGLGCAPLGNLYTAISDQDAADTVHAAWTAGWRYFDTAPHYGLGLSERRLGTALSGYPRDSYTLSTKVGRRLVPSPDHAHRQDLEGFAVPAAYRRVWDFTADGVRRSLDESLRRLEVDRIDLVLLHDPEGHERDAVEKAYPALCELRDQGVVNAIGAGSKNNESLSWFVDNTDLDVVMVAGRYTLLDQAAADDLFPLCAARGIRVINAGVFNSGLLAQSRPHAGLPFEYAAAPAAMVERAAAIASLCTRHGTTLPAAALAFAAAPPPVTTVVVGSQTAEQVRRNAALMAAPPPADLWTDLIDCGLLRPGLPVPKASA
ncbi:aldo/keto reductase [Actinoplanes sp. CA-030573]|uniref:aldo/keto reductase n=1 Tax=Actinoplanes sp. CA-030573 TaxID=3239898 RepID=UPI003D8CB883